MRRAAAPHLHDVAKLECLLLSRHLMQDSATSGQYVPESATQMQLDGILR